jgi:glycerol uptake facilitator-like aquaporin
MDPRLARSLLAEAIGTFALVFAGCGAIMVDATTHQLGHVGVAISFGLVIMVMIYAAGHISGAHFNPAVTLAFATSRHFPWPRVPLYWAAQLAGGLAAALILGGDHTALWVYLTAPFLGAVVAAATYRVLRSDAQRPASLPVKETV